MRDAFNVILLTSADICVVHDDLGWKNSATRYNCRFSATSLALRVIFLGRTTKQHVIIGFGIRRPSPSVILQSFELLHAF